jgi:membrane protease subunit HflC
MEEIRDRVYRLASGKEEMKEPVVAPAAKTPEEADLAAAAGASSEVEAAREGFGIEVVDVRIMRTDLPKETSTPIYDRMRSDRQKVAEKFRAEGRKESQIIRSEADKERTIIEAEAEKKAQIIRGEGDANATRIFAESFGADEEFYGFYRSMQAYRKSLGKEDTTLILSPDSEFLRFMERSR